MDKEFVWLSLFNSSMNAAVSDVTYRDASDWVVSIGRVALRCGVAADIGVLEYEKRFGQLQDSKTLDEEMVDIHGGT